MAVWYQKRHAVSTTTGAEKRGQFKLMGMIYHPFSQLVGDTLYGFIAVRQVNYPQWSNSKEAVSNM